MAGRKFGASDREDLTWAMNAHVPALVAEAFASPASSPIRPDAFIHMSMSITAARRENAGPPPPGAYANSCVAREAMFQYFSHAHRTPGRLIRLNYAIDMRYGVLHDVATRV